MSATCCRLLSVAVFLIAVSVICLFCEDVVDASRRTTGSSDASQASLGTVFRLRVFRRFRRPCSSAAQRLLVRVEARSDWSSLVTFGTVSMSYLATHWWARSGEGQQTSFPNRALASANREAGGEGQGRGGARRGLGQARWAAG